MGQNVVESGHHVVPVALVFVFFLHPHDLCVLVLLNLRDNESEGEGTELFNPDDGDVVSLFLDPCCIKIIEDLAGTENDPLYFVVAHKALVCFRNDSLESQTLLELFQTRRSVLESQEFLGGDDYQRLSEVPPHLSPQHVEVLGCCGWVDHLHVHSLDSF